MQIIDQPFTSEGKSPAQAAEGCLLAHACGNALGNGYESWPRERLPRIDGLDMPERFLPTGYWTDDTGLLLCLADSLVAQGFDPRDQMQRYLAYRDQGEGWPDAGLPPPLGNTMNQALDAFKRTDEVFAGSTSALASGNGALMRMPALALWSLSQPSSDLLETWIVDATRTTHASPLCLEASRLLVFLLLHLFQAAPDDSSLAEQLTSQADEIWAEEAIADLAEGLYLEKPRDLVPSGGFVAHTLEAALWSLANSPDLKTALLKAVNLGGDCDTVAAITGALGGAFYGVEALPREWRDQLLQAERLRTTARQLLAGNSLT
ncbi:ADP-ribosyl-[dinitrogen reductase] hydrolase [Marinospirillum celere]|uniref:ADP-ribosyl-[dinitrogen reductase] hydrolase n=2 Tax=Marinospirillum celere TaxID=1122252 RepID=A0A1I1EKM8_9GAMM|nr:ADP-ribosyl-[dinitrogen reductase] hydrolase [Marinospirillum celere]